MDDLNEHHPINREESHEHEKVRRASHDCEEGISLEFKDYIAIFIAALQTIMAPMLLFIVATIILLLIINVLT